MSITSCGLSCDIGGEYLIAEVFMGTPVRGFSVEGIRRTLHVCDQHEPILRAASKTGRWEELPDGPLKRAFVNAQARLDARNKVRP